MTLNTWSAISKMGAFGPCPARRSSWKFACPRGARWPRNPADVELGPTATGPATPPNSPKPAITRHDEYPQHTTARGTHSAQQVNRSLPVYWAVCRRTSPKSLPATRTSMSRWVTRPSTPTRPSNRTWRFWPAAEPYAPLRNTGHPPMRNGSNSSVTSSAARFPSVPAGARSGRPVSTNMLVSVAHCSGQTRRNKTGCSKSVRT